MTLKLNGSSSGYTAIDAPAAAGSNTLVLPANNGSAGQILQTDGSGNLTWVDKPTSGLAEADQWRVTTTFNSASTGVNSNWERVDSRGSAGPLGTGMSESSGTFTFPSTGYWLVFFKSYCAGTEADWTQIQIMATLNNNDMNAVARTRSACKDADSHTSMSAQALVDVTDVSNVKVKFNVAAGAAIDWYGHTDQSETSAVFLKLGAT